MADFLVKILLETKQGLPEFWADRKPAEGEAITFNDESGDEDEEEETAGAGEDAWAAGGDTGDAWGTGETTIAAAPAEKCGWTAEPATSGRW
jgi:hypothetical protein